jgi:hypothetical protein
MNLSLSRTKPALPERQTQAQRRTVLWLGLLSLFIALPFLSRLLLPTLTTFPESLNIGLREPVDDFQSWVIGNRKDHPAFLYFFNPVSDSIDALVKGLENLLLELPWLFIVVLAFMLGLRASTWRVALFCAVGLLFAGFVGLWKDADPCPHGHLGHYLAYHRHSTRDYFWTF